MLSTLLLACPLFAPLVAPLFAQAAPQASLAAPLHEVRFVVRGSTEEPNGPPPGMVLVPGGEVTMGLDEDEILELGQKNEIDLRALAASFPKITMQTEDVYIDRTEVTNLQWRVFLEATGREPGPQLVEFGWPSGQIPDGQEYFPVGNVSYADIRAYLAWCGKRLPTEAEWVRAARSDTLTMYPWGDRFDRKYCQSGLTLPHAPVQVGSYPEGASPFGLLDMAGNLWEIVDSPFSAYEGYKPIPYKKGRETVMLSPPFTSTQVVAKGGAFTSVKKFVTVDTRIGVGRTDNDAGLGFRAARSVRPGVDVIRDALQALLPPLLSSKEIDYSDVFCQEVTGYDDARNVITGYQYLAFGHVAQDRGTFSAMKRDSKDEPIPLGMISGTQYFVEPNLPPGAYAVAYKVAGESKKHRQRRMDAKKSKEGEPEAPVIPPPPTGDDLEAGAAAPWPGVGGASWDPNIIVEDIEFPQEEDVILFYNVNNAVVGWVRAGEVTEDELSGIKGTPSDDRKTYSLSFSLDLTRSKRHPRFAFDIKLANALKR